ncbi:hypothetical protein QBC45DRAFT_48189 [Copromyces sp. CBS 386.78]|nr:hypothetical protein QBC45DRAFT_48189 [Copromyces sp. CBS 386.78]
MRRKRRNAYRHRHRERRFREVSPWLWRKTDGIGGCHVKGCLPPRRGRPTYRPAGKLATTPKRRSTLAFPLSDFQKLMLDSAMGIFTPTRVFLFSSLVRSTLQGPFNGDKSRIRSLHSVMINTVTGGLPSSEEIEAQAARMEMFVSSLGTCSHTALKKKFCFMDSPGWFLDVHAKSL